MIATQVYFRKHTSVAMGIAGLGASIAAITFPVLLRFLIDEFTLRGCLLIHAAIFIQGIPIACMIRPVPKMPSASQAEVKELNKCQKITGFLRSVFDMSLLKDPRVCLYSIAVLACHIFSVTMYSFIIIRGISHGLSKQEAGVAMTVFGATGVAGRLLIGWIGDCVSRLALFSACAMISGLSAITNALHYNRMLNIVCSSFTGFCVGRLKIVPSKNCSSMEVYSYLHGYRFYN